MLTLENIKDWLVTKIDIGEGIDIGTIDGEKDRYIGVYSKATEGSQYICIGGIDATIYQTKTISILVHWTLSAVLAEQKAYEIYNLFYGLTQQDMSGVKVYSCDPGAGPIPAGKDTRGVFEYSIDVTLQYERGN